MLRENYDGVFRKLKKKTYTNTILNRLFYSTMYKFFSFDDLFAT